MFENPRRGRQARNFTTNVPKILVLKSSSEQKFSRKLPLGAHEDFSTQQIQLNLPLTKYHLKGVKSQGHMSIVDMYMTYLNFSLRTSQLGGSKLKM